MIIQLKKNQIFSIGKSLNFIRYSCHDSDWVVTNGKATGADKRNYLYSSRVFFAELNRC
jgi:gamma-tubulin complex component 3